jgi:capsular exopolysaccharide synthesis family protein
MQTPGWAPAPSDGSFLDLGDYVKVVKRHWKLVVAAAAIAVAAAGLWTSVQTRVYTGVAEVLVRPPLSGSTLLGAAQPLNVVNEREIMNSLPVAAIAAQRVELGETPRQLLDRLEVVTRKDTDVLQVRFTHPDPAIAAQGAQGFATGYLDYSNKRAQDMIDGRIQAIADNIAALRDQNGTQAAIAALNQQIAELRAIPVSAGDILVPAEPPRDPTSPDLVLNLALALFLGLFVGLVAAFVRERLDDRLRGRGDLEETIGVPVMTMIPQVPSWRERSEAHLVALEGPRSPAAEAYRTLRTSILVAAAERGLKTLMVVSAGAGEGKTTTAANLAVVLAQADKRVVLISADLRRPRLHEFFGLPSSEHGLAEVLGGTRRAWESLRSGKVDNLWIMASGKIPEQPTELLQSEAMRELIAEQREVVDFIIIDCPPVLAVADSLVLAPMVDGVVFVADAHDTPRAGVLQARAQLDQVGARLLGAVLNDVEASGAGYAYYGQYVYGPTDAGSANGKANVWEALRRDRSAG